jgi:hypothetical protein
VAADDQQVAKHLAEELKRLRVEDVLVNLLVTVSSIGYRRLGATPDTADDRDLDQVRLAIDTMDDVTPVLERVVPDQLVADFRSAVSNLKLAYARLASGGDAAPAPSAGGEDDDAAG